jgi:3-methyl-2-oxobutanoate hydroxymethyltransferase
MTTTNTLKEMKKAGKKITMLTAYDAPTASVVHEAGVDIILVGDSLANTILGYDDTIPVTMDEMLHHTKAVVRGAPDAFVVADMPFMSYQVTPEEALRNAARFLKEAGAKAVKIEGSIHLEAIKKIIDAGIPVMGHIGFTPQSVNCLGGYRVQGRSINEAKDIFDAAKFLEKMGVFALVLEMTPSQLSDKISRTLEIPVISCGAGVECDGQVLVLNDVLGLSKTSPKFAKKFGDVRAEMKKAAMNYISDVRSKRFPGPEHSF